MTDIKYRARLLYDVPGWAYHRRCNALQKYAPEGWEVTTGHVYGAAFRQAAAAGEPIDLALQLCYDCTNIIRRHIEKGRYDMTLVSGLNVASEAARPYLDKQQSNADWTVFNSRMGWEKSGQPERTSWISNGVDREVFCPRENPNMRKPKVLCIGSKFHRNNKGFTNILQDVERELKPHGILCDFRCIDSHGRDRMNESQMADWYNTGTIYVVASQREGTPNPALEAASSGCVLVATEVGNMPELIQDGHNGRLVPRDTMAIVQAIVECSANYRRMWAAMEPIIAGWHWRIRASEYYDLFSRLIDERREGAACRNPVAGRG